MATATGRDVLRALGVSLVGKNVFVTGASAGIGAQTAKDFAFAGANVWLAGRDVAKTTAVRDVAVAELPDAASRLHVVKLDLANLASVRAASREFLALGIPLHLLINNAGYWTGSKETTDDGFERQLGALRTNRDL